MKCRICLNDSTKIFDALVLKKFMVQYFHCPHCHFIETEQPYWLPEAYKNSISITDTGIIERNVRMAKISSLIINFFSKKDGYFLDYAGGYGIFVRLMRDLGYNFYWQDPFSENIFAKGFEYDERLHAKIELLTSFESFEHFEHPLSELKKMLTLSDKILISTFLIPNNELPKMDWWYYSFSQGQHISFYSRKTLKIIAEKFSLHLYSNGSDLHLFSKTKIPFFNISVITKLKALGVHNFVRFFLKSKTMSDSIMLSR